MNKLNLLDYEEFLQALIKIKKDSNSDRQVVRDFLKEHQNKLDLTFAEVITQWFNSNIDPNNSENNKDIASLLNSIAINIKNFPLGRRINNIEIAIICYQSVLTVYTLDAFPKQWAMTQNNLAAAYRNRIKGSRADNLECAIACYQAALTVRTPNTFPEQWARTQNNLAIAYRNRIKGSKADNLECAIACYQDALTVRTPDTFPEQWARTQNNLGEAYRNRIKGSKADNLECAIVCYQAALTVRTPDTFPEQWAMTQNDLAIVYRNRIKGSRADNLECAITCHQDALTVRTLDAFPEKWATTQNDLGEVYKNRINGAKADNLKCAIQYYQAALTIRTPDNLPQDCLESARNLGDLGFDQERWDIAKEGYLLGIEAVEKMCEWSPPEAHQQIREDALDVYEKMILACLNSDDLATALATVERSKSRIVVQMLFDANLQPKNATPEQLERFQTLRQEYLSFYPVSNTQIDNPDTDNPDTTNQPTDTSARSYTQLTSNQEPNQFEQIKQARQQLEQALNNLLKEINDPDFSLTQKITPILLSEIQNLLDEKTVILNWYILGEDQASWLTFIVTKDHIQVKHFTDPEQYQTLQQWQQEYFKDYQTENYERKGQPWSEKLTERLQQLSNILGLNEILQAISDEQGELLYQKLILIPHQFLHILPLTALPAQIETKNGTKNGCLMELFPQGVHFVPNCRILERLQQRQNLLDKEIAGQLFAVQNPTDNLLYADVEITTIKAQIVNQFQIDPTILAKTEATKTRLLSPEILDILKKSKYLHFACHAGFNSENPSYSALQLAKEISNDPTADNLPENLPKEKDRLVTIRNGERFDPVLQGLTMQEIVAKLDLQQAILVILSACETGLINWQNIDEYIGLPSSFLLAGALRVIASNWLVDDFTTAFLMVRAYYNYLSGEYTITQSLQQAQIWLKNVSLVDFIKWLEKDLQFDQQDLENCQIKIMRSYKKDYPFASPKYWASFSSIGLN
jgi:CHAT domain-containing protein